MSEPIMSPSEFREKKPEAVAEFVRLTSSGMGRSAKLFAAYMCRKVVRDLGFDSMDIWHLGYLFSELFIYGRGYGIAREDDQVLTGFIDACCEPCKALAKLFLDLHNENPKFGRKEWKDKILEMEQTGDLDKYLAIPNEEIEEEIRKEKEEKEKAEKREPLTEEQTLKALHLGKYCIVVPYTTGVCYRDLSRTADTKEGLERLLTPDERRFGHTYWCETTCDEYPILQEKRR